MQIVHVGICIIAFQLLCSCCKGIEPVPPNLVKSWLQAKWDESLTLEVVDEFARRLTDRPGFNAILLPFCDNVAPKPDTSFSKSLHRAIKDVKSDNGRRRYVSDFCKTHDLSSEKGEAVFRELTGCLEDVSTSPNLRVACRYALSQPGNAEALFLPLLISTNLASYEQGRERDAIKAQLKDTMDAFRNIPNERVLTHILSLRLTLRDMVNAVEYQIAPTTDGISLDVREPVYPFALPLLNSQEFSCFVDKFDDVNRESIGPMHLRFSESELLDAIRVGEVVTLARYHYRECLIGMITNINMLSRESYKFGLDIRDVMEQLIWLSIFSDDLKLARAACGGHSDYRRMVHESPDAAGEVIPSLDEATRQRLLKLSAQRKHLFSIRILDTRKMVIENRRRAAAYFQKRTMGGKE